MLNGCSPGSVILMGFAYTMMRCEAKKRGQQACRATSSRPRESSACKKSAGTIYLPVTAYSNVAYGSSTVTLSPGSSLSM